MRMCFSLHLFNLSYITLLKGRRSGMHAWQKNEEGKRKKIWQIRCGVVVLLPKLPASLRHFHLLSSSFRVLPFSCPAQTASSVLAALLSSIRQTSSWQKNTCRRHQNLSTLNCCMLDPFLECDSTWVFCDQSASVPCKILRVCPVVLNTSTLPWICAHTDVS